MDRASPFPRGCAFALVGSAAAVLVAVFAFVGVLFAIGAALTVSTDATVTGHAWRRAIAVEVWRLEQHRTACSSVPGDATVVEGPGAEAAGRIPHHHRTSPSHHHRPPAPRCTWERWEWAVDGEIVETGGRDEPRRWPAWTAETCPVPTPGCTRPGAASEEVHLALRSSAGVDLACAVDEATWAAIADGDRVRLEVLRPTGAPMCSTLAAIPGGGG